jgi:hypothetical protein
MKTLSINRRTTNNSGTTNSSRTIAELITGVFSQSTKTANKFNDDYEEIKPRPINKRYKTKQIRDEIKKEELKKIDNFITYQTCQENMTQDQLIEINKFLQEQMRIIKTQKKTEISR